MDDQTFLIEVLKSLEPSVVSEIKIPAEYKMVDSFQLCRGHRLYSINLINWDITEEPLPTKTESIDIHKQKYSSHRVYMKQNCIYFGSLNRKNAIRNAQAIVFKGMLRYGLHR